MASIGQECNRSGPPLWADPEGLHLVGIREKRIQENLVMVGEGALCAGGNIELSRHTHAVDRNFFNTAGDKLIPYSVFRDDGDTQVGLYRFLGSR